MLAEVFFYLGLLLTPLAGLLCLRLVLSTGWVTERTEERDVWFSETPQEVHSYKSPFHKAATWVVGVFGVWFLTLILYVFIVDSLMVSP